MTIVKAAIFLLAAASFGVTSTKPIAAESEQAQFYNSPAAAAANLPFSQAVRVGDIWYLSGAIGVVPGKMELAPGGLEAEAKQTWPARFLQNQLSPGSHSSADLP